MRNYISRILNCVWVVIIGVAIAQPAGEPFALPDNLNNSERSEVPIKESWGKYWAVLQCAPLNPQNGAGSLGWQAQLPGNDTQIRMPEEARRGVLAILPVGRQAAILQAKIIPRVSKLYLVISAASAIKQSMMSNWLLVVKKDGIRVAQVYVQSRWQEYRFILNQREMGSPTEIVIECHWGNSVSAQFLIDEIRIEASPDQPQNHTSVMNPLFNTDKSATSDSLKATINGDLINQVQQWTQAMTNSNADNAAPDSETKNLHTDGKPEKTPAGNDKDYGFTKNFEEGTLRGWTVESGDAFRENPRNTSYQNKNSVRYEGNYFLSSEISRLGQLASTAFLIDCDTISFLISGGANRARTAFHLQILGQPFFGRPVSWQTVFTETGNGTTLMRRAYWDVRSYKGKTARFRVVDDAAEALGFVGLDDIRFIEAVFKNPVAALLPIPLHEMKQTLMNNYSETPHAKQRDSLQALAEQGDANAQGILSGLHFRDENYKASKHWATQSANQGNGIGLFYRAAITAIGVGEPINNDLSDLMLNLAVPKLTEMAAGGSGEAAYCLAKLYLDGNGVPKDISQAEALFAQSAEAGSMNGMRELAEIYLKRQEIEKAMTWYHKTIKKGDGLSLYALYRHYAAGNAGVGVKLNEAIIHYVEAAAATGNLFAINYLGDLYYEGNVLEKDFSKARQLWEIGSTQSSSTALRNLGYMLVSGVDGYRDYARAFQLYTESAAHGDAKAIFNIGVFYERGHYVREDEIKAFEYYREAAARGHKTAIEKVRTDSPVIKDWDWW